jgi:hypothetical protein
VRARRARGHGLCGCAAAGTLVLVRLVERSPDSSARHGGTLCCTTSDRPDDSADERAATTAASESEHHPYIEHPFAAQ